MKEVLIEVCKKYNIDIKKLNLDQCVANIIDDIERGLIDRTIETSNPRILMAELWKINQEIENSDLLSEVDLKSELDKILKDKDYSFCGKYITCQKYIPCTVIQCHNRTVLLNERQQKILVEHGYGILSYKVRFGKTIMEVYCEGNHPNLSINTKQFCLDGEFLDLPLTRKNLVLLEELLSHFNMIDSFIPVKERDKIMEAI